jgi:alkylation response protein AidB-like acyl-CoA dehydrogenase
MNISLSNFFTDADGNYINHLPVQVIKHLQERKYFKMLLPKQWGGLGLNIAQTLPVLRNLAYANGSLGWLVQIANGGTYFAPYLPTQVAESLFSNNNAVLAGSGAVTGTAIPCQNGFVVSGSWNYCSGADYATFFTVNCAVVGSSRVISCVLLPTQVKVINTWNTLGLKNTSTHLIEADEAFVTNDYTFSLNQPLQSNNFENMKMPFMSFAQLYFMQTFFGIAHRFFVEIKNLAEKRREAWQNRSKTICEKCHDDLAHLFNCIELTLTHAEKICDNSQTELINNFDAFIKSTKQEIMQRVHALFAMAGTAVLQKDNIVNIFYQDLMAAAQHSLLNNYSN